MATIDYSKRKSENLSKAIESIYGLRINDEADKALSIASQGFSELTDKSLGDILKLSTEEYANFIQSQGYSFTFIERIVSFLLETSATYNLLLKNEEAENLLDKGIAILKYLIDNDKTYSTERVSLYESLQKQIK